jgi:hypothetical protein
MSTSWSRWGVAISSPGHPIGVELSASMGSDDPEKSSRMVYKGLVTTVTMQLFAPVPGARVRGHLHLDVPHWAARDSLWPEKHGRSADGDFDVALCPDPRGEFSAFRSPTSEAMARPIEGKLGERPFKPVRVVATRTDWSAPQVRGTLNQIVLLEDPGGCDAASLGRGRRVEVTDRGRAQRRDPLSGEQPAYVAVKQGSDFVASTEAAFVEMSTFDVDAGVFDGMLFAYGTNDDATFDFELAGAFHGTFCPLDTDAGSRRP